MPDEEKGPSFEGSAWDDDECEEEIIDPSQPKNSEAEPPVEDEVAPKRFKEHFPLPEGVKPGSPVYDAFDKRHFNKGRPKIGLNQKEQMQEARKELEDIQREMDDIPDLQDDLEVKKYLKQSRTSRIKAMVDLAKSAKSEAIRADMLKRLQEMDTGKTAPAPADDGSDEIGSVIIGEL